MRRIALALIGFLALAGVIGYAATSGGLTNTDDSASSVGAGSAPTIGVAEGGFDAATAPDEAARGEAAAGDGSVSQLALLPEIGSSVIRTGTIAVEVKSGGFAQAFDTASLLAGRYGGYVQSSSMSGTKRRSGELLLRVPADRFDEAVSALRALGTVEQQSVSGEDVSGQFVDLEARLRTWEAQETVLLDLMSRATSIEDTIRVQTQLQDVQMRIEEIKGQLNLLQDRTDFATIQVSLYEPGTATTLSQTDSSRPSLAEAWERALDGFLGVCYSVVVGVGYLVPIGAIAGLCWLGYRRLRAPRRASPAA
jgi:hypothetical protein